MTSRPSPPTSHRGRMVLVGIVLGIPIVLPLLVPTYARSEPDIAGIPFFFWYQFALIPVAAILTFVAYRLVTSMHDERRRLREQREERS